MARRKSTEYEVLKDLKRISKINGAVRTVSIAINSSGSGRDNPAVYGSALDSGNVPGQKQDYHFSDAGGYTPDYFSNPKIKKSIDGIVSGKRRPSDELDDISIEMAKMAAGSVVEFIDTGANWNYQWWKGTNSENLYETGKLRDSIVGVASRKDGKVIWRGR
ncbi:MAG: hypothetical protein ACRCX7_11060 [Cetobacterium sp.]|uniref:hypothetical protein n=1 Tax=Cetobacterium sp. TaxID=2071632 RepID=UPI003F39149F